MVNFDRISSRENSIIKLAVKLQNSSKARRENGLFVLEGLRLCFDAVQSEFNVDSLIVTDEAYEKYTEMVEKISLNSKKSYIISAELFGRISDTQSPQGVMCICKMPGLDLQIKSNAKYIALENTQDPANLGTIARTAEAMGIDGLIVSAAGCDPFSPKAQRAGMGALIRLPVFVVSDFLDKLDTLKNNGYKLYAAVVGNADELITNVKFNDSCIMLIGNEANGLTADLIDISDSKITIPMKGKAESLNAAAAAAILIWEMTK
ncbi:MAG: RNA methyltransferase [Oscillospiraceae bacterium]|nr:RNA methyltransferase [Oscillospiraceae bacterium]